MSVWFTFGWLVGWLVAFCLLTARCLIDTNSLVKFLEGVDGMQQLFRTLIVTLPGLANVTGLLFLLFFIYAVIGVQLFATVAFHGEYNEQANFRTFGSAMLLLLRMATGAPITLCRASSSIIAQLWSRLFGLFDWLQARIGTPLCMISHTKLRIASTIRTTIPTRAATHTSLAASRWTAAAAR